MGSAEARIFLLDLEQKYKLLLEELKSYPQSQPSERTENIL